ncbi:MAG: energy transducer TonB [Ferruginibacter sp.]
MTAMKDNTTAKMDTAGASTPMDTSMAGMKNLKDTMPVKIIPGKNGKRAKIVIVLPKMNSTSAMNADKEGAYDNVEVWPSYPGGQKALENFFSNNIEYPQQATDNATEGTVNVSFLVDESGKVSSPKIVGKKLGDGLEDETMRVFNKMPNWTPGKIKGKNVKTRFTLPVKYQLES